MNMHNASDFGGFFTVILRATNMVVNLAYMVFCLHKSCE